MVECRVELGVGSLGLLRFVFLGDGRAVTLYNICDFDIGHKKLIRYRLKTCLRTCKTNDNKTVNEFNSILMKTSSLTLKRKHVVNLCTANTSMRKLMLDRLSYLPGQVQ